MKNITLSKIQTTVDNWIKKNGICYFSELTNLGQLMEEVGEVSRIITRKYGDQSFKNQESDLDLSDELADVLFVLICIANQTNINLSDAFLRNIEKKNVRDKNRHKLNLKLQNKGKNV